MRLCALALRGLLLGCGLLLGACSNPGKEPDRQWQPLPAADPAFILREVYSGKYCFQNHYYWRDSARNEQEICQVQGQFCDTVNHAWVDMHHWNTGRVCDTNVFLVVRQASRAWFVPFCDEGEFRRGRARADTAFFKTNVAVAMPLNEALRGMALNDRPRFIVGLLDRLFMPQGRLGSRNYAALLDPKTRAYLRPRLDWPNRYYYHRNRYGHTETVWEFDDTHPDGLRVRVIQPGRYTCIEM